MPLPCRSIALGDIELILVPDGDMLRPSGEGVYGVPAGEGWGGYTPPDEDGNIAVMPHSLLVKGPDGIALLDTGGENSTEVPDRNSDFMERLAALDVHPGDVSAVILTHAHLDHIGYNTRLVDGKWVPVFPNAAYFIQEAESEAMRVEDPERWDRYFRPIDEAGKLRRVTGDGPAAQGLACIATPGHTAGHQVVLIECRAGERAIYLGDLATTMLHLENVDWSPEWCWSAEAEQESKVRVIKLALECDAVLIFGHDPHVSWGRLRREDAPGLEVAVERYGG